MTPGAGPDAGMFTQLVSFAGALVPAVLIADDLPLPCAIQLIPATGREDICIRVAVEPSGVAQAGVLL